MERQANNYWGWGLNQFYSHKISHLSLQLYPIIQEWETNANTHNTRSKKQNGQMLKETSMLASDPENMTHRNKKKATM